MTSATENLVPAALPPLTPSLPAPQLRPARFEDYPQIARLEASYGLASLTAENWRGLWLDNPLWGRLGTNWPIGWVLESAGGRLVGTLSNIPSRYTFRGRELICANGRSWVVCPEYRGVALWLFGEYFGQENADLFINTTVSHISATAIGALSARVPVGDWQQAAYWVTGYYAFARSALRIKGGRPAGLLAPPAAAVLRLKDTFVTQSLPAPPAWVEIAEAGRFDSRFDAFWDELVGQNPDKLLAARDSQTLSWHFQIPMRAARLWILTASRGGLLRAYCVLKRQWMPQGLRCVRVVDYQTLEPEEDLLPALLRAALRRCAVDRIDILEHLGSGLPKMRSLDQFAPHRRKLRAWPFYYRAADPSLDADLAKPESWDPSLFDGDASFD